MHCESQTSGQDDVVHSHYGVHDRACDDSVGDGDVPYDTSRLDGGNGANSSDPNTGMDRCNGMDATNVDNTPNSMVSANIPKMCPRTNHKSLDDRYIQAR